jgi:hypothetical protein
MQFDVQSTEQLQAIEHKRRALEAVVRIARSIEKFEQSLQAVLLLKGSSLQIPKAVLKTFRNLENQFEGRSNTEIEQAIKGLEHLLQHDLAQIFEITRADEKMVLSASRAPGADYSQQEMDEIGHLLDVFRRRAQTAVHLRVMLRERGIQTAPLSFGVDDDDIQIHINVLMAEEAVCRSRILAGIEEVCADISAILGSQELPEGIQHSLEETRQGLESNMALLKSGRKIEDIPFQFEEISMAGSVNGVAETAAETAPAGDIEREPVQPPPDANRANGFFRSLYLWLTTPWGTGWKAIRAGKIPRKTK